MISLGINFGYHDSSICIAKDGEIIFFSEEDRFTYLKHDSNYPYHSLNYALSYLSLTIDQIDTIIYCENPYEKFIDRLDQLVKYNPFSIKLFFSFTKKWLGRDLWPIFRISSKLQIPLDRIKYINHHEAHHLSITKQTNLQNPVSLIIDAVGQKESISLYYQNKLLHKINQSNSICYFYSLMTFWLGFSPNSSECTTMAISSFGTHFSDIFEKILLFKDGEIILNQDFLNLRGLDFNDHILQIENIFGKSKSPNEQLPLSCYKDYCENDLANIAFSLQQRFEELIILYLNFHTKDIDSNNLCISGGGAQNCKLIRKIREGTKFTSIDIPQAPGDSGLAIGAALSVFENCSKKKNFYLGSGTETQEISDILEEQIALQNKSSSSDLFKNIFVEKFISDDELANLCATEIDNNKIIGIIRDRAEIGPRALGNRSIVSRCDSTEIAIKICDKIKSRSHYRPFAISTTEEKAKATFDFESLDSTFYSMQTDVKIKKEYENNYIGAIHVDKTTRPQIVSPSQTFFYKVISKTNQQAVLNTSFNESGYPLCKSAKEGLLFFLKKPIDILIIDNYFLRKL